jgi:deoxyribodipyrimidine photolyase-related protein
VKPETDRSVRKARLLLVLGDQLSLANPVIAAADTSVDEVLMAEVSAEAHYARHSRHKLVLFFSAMRHFAAKLQRRGFAVHYVRLEDGVKTLEEALLTRVSLDDYASVEMCEPGEHRVLTALEDAEKHLGIPLNLSVDSRFLCSREEFSNWADSRSQLRQEHFYRTMRKRSGLLLDEEGKPAGGRWNYDRENRKGWRAAVEVPARPAIKKDAVTREVLREVEKHFPDNPGVLSEFNYAVTAEQAQAQLDWFCEEALPRFGTWQDGLAEESPWLFHSVIALYLNIGLLDPGPVCQQVESVWRDGGCDLAAAEGFIRQVLGWREYVRGIYWHLMPDYSSKNYLQATTPLPDWFWNAEVDLRCLSVALRQSLELGYAHHIQRLMVIGNFALLAGVDVEEVCAWYLGVYVDIICRRRDNGEQALRRQRQVYSAAGKPLCELPVRPAPFHR